MRNRGPLVNALLKATQDVWECLNDAIIRYEQVAWEVRSEHPNALSLLVDLRVLKAKTETTIKQLKSSGEK